MCQGHKKLYLNKQVSDIVGITPRQVLSWTEKGLIEPFEEAMGIGTKRRYNYVNLLEFSLCESFFSIGLGFRAVKRVMDDLRKSGWMREWAEDFSTYYLRTYKERTTYIEGRIEELKKLKRKDLDDLIMALTGILDTEKKSLDEPKEIVGVLLYFIDDQHKKKRNYLLLWPGSLEHLIILSDFKERILANTGCIFIDLGKIKNKIDKNL